MLCFTATQSKIKFVLLDYKGVYRGNDGAYQLKKQSFIYTNKLTKEGSCFVKFCYGFGTYKFKPKKVHLHGTTHRTDKVSIISATNSWRIVPKILKQWGPRNITRRLKWFITNVRWICFYTCVHIFCHLCYFIFCQRIILIRFIVFGCNPDGPLRLK